MDKGKSYILITLIALFVLLMMTGCKGSVSPDVSSELDSASQDAVDAKPDSIETTDKPIASDQSSVDESIEVIETIEELEYDSGKTVEEERVGDFTLKYLFHNPLLDMEDHELTDENFVKLKGGYSRVFPFYSDKCTVQLVAIDYLEGTKIVFDIANRDNNDLVINGDNLYFSGGRGEKNVSGEVIIPSGTIKRVALSTNDVEAAEANISFGGLHLNYALERPKYYIQDTTSYTDNAYEYFNDRIELKGLYDIGGNGKVKCQILELKLLHNKPSELFANEVMDDIGLAALLKLRLANTSGEDIKVNEISSLRTFKEVNARTYYIYDNELIKKWADFCLPMEIKADTIVDGYIPVILYHEHFAANSLLIETSAGQIEVKNLDTLTPSYSKTGNGASFEGLPKEIESEDKPAIEPSKVRVTYETPKLSLDRHVMLPDWVVPRDMRDTYNISEYLYMFKGELNQMLPNHFKDWSIQLVDASSGQESIMVFDIGNLGEEPILINDDNMQFVSYSQGGVNIARSSIDGGQVSIPPNTIERVTVRAANPVACVVNFNIRGFEGSIGFGYKYYDIITTKPFLSHELQWLQGKDVQQTSSKNYLLGNEKYKALITDVYMTDNEPVDFFNILENPDDWKMVVLVKLKVANTSDEELILLNGTCAASGFYESMRHYYSEEEWKRWGEGALPYIVPPQTIVEGYIPVVLFNEINSSSLILDTNLGWFCFGNIETMTPNFGGDAVVGRGFDTYKDYGRE